MRVGKLVGLIHKDLKGRLRKHLLIAKTTKKTKMRKKERRQNDESEAAQEGYSPSKENPYAENEERVNRKDTKESKSFMEPSKSGEDITRERKQRKQSGKITDESLGNKQSNIDEEIKPYKQDGGSSEGCDERRQLEEPEAAQEGYSPPKKIPAPKTERILKSQNHSWNLVQVVKIS